jgi:hypothetical protein
MKIQIQTLWENSNPLGAIVYLSCVKIPDWPPAARRVHGGSPFLQLQVYFKFPVYFRTKPYGSMYTLMIDTNFLKSEKFFLGFHPFAAPFDRGNIGQDSVEYNLGSSELPPTNLKRVGISGREHQESTGSENRQLRIAYYPTMRRLRTMPILRTGNLNIS